ncbi:MAG: glycoside hydrolase family 15 protein [Conexivisphaerales archaeon]|nr:glycoside hydrolase family 15 protein [Conexivisphaerales archaeon]
MTCDAPNVDHGFISNGYGAALISRDASVEWLSLPRFDSPPIFCSLLDDRLDCALRIRAAGMRPVGRRYIRGSLALETRLASDGGSIVVRDVMPRSEPALMRMIESEAPIEMIANPVFNYGLVNPAYEQRDSGATFTDPTSDQSLEVRIRWSSPPASAGRGRWRLAPGSGHVTVLYSAERGYGLFSPKAAVYGTPGEALSSTIRYWRSELGMNRVNPPPWARRVYMTSLEVLLGLMYSPSGALISSPTTSLPESIGEGRNWDYRFAWVRDSSIAAEALAAAGLIIDAREVLNFLFSVLDPSSKPFNYVLFSLDGSPPPPERELGWLSGFACSRPVRTGNAAALQLQLDIEGEFMAALDSYYRSTGDVEYLSGRWWAVESIAKYALRSYLRPDAGIWEERGVSRHNTHSKVMTWYALHSASEMARDMGEFDEAERWAAGAARVRDWIMENSWSDADGSFVSHPGSHDVDASLLVMPLYGFIDAADGKFLSTLRRIEEELVVDGLIYRYRRDFLGAARHPFALASAWMARVKLRLGDRRGAESYLRGLASCANDLGLLGEHVEAGTCEARGNYPHVFSHAGFVHAVAELARGVTPSRPSGARAAVP